MVLYSMPSDAAVSITRFSPSRVMKPPSMPLHQLQSERPGTIHDVSANSSGSGAGLRLVMMSVFTSASRSRAMIVTRHGVTMSPDSSNPSCSVKSARRLAPGSARKRMPL
ncbi:unknown [Alistipes finegoldii CAG:68]|nr:unknown [Alistipes finegoldii CAG:68]